MTCIWICFNNTFHFIHLIDWQIFFIITDTYMLLQASRCQDKPFNFTQTEDKTEKLKKCLGLWRWKLSIRNKQYICNYKLLIPILFTSALFIPPTNFRVMYIFNIKVAAEQQISPTNKQQCIMVYHVNPLRNNMLTSI